MNKKILVIDDEELIIKTMAKLLEKQNYYTFVVRRGEDAEVIVEEESFDLIISDIRMPGQNGIDTIRNIFRILDKRNEKRPPVIFVTGYADKKLETEAKKLLPVAYMYKPFDFKTLVDTVNSILDK